MAKIGKNTLGKRPPTDRDERKGEEWRENERRKGRIMNSGTMANYNSLYALCKKGNFEIIFIQLFNAHLLR